MPYDFDKTIDRRNTNSDKWDGMEGYYGVSPQDGLAMWTADMDFAAPPAVNATLVRLAEHGVHGYFGAPSAYLAAIQHWMATRHEWEVAPEWILSTHGVLHAIGAALQAYTQPGDRVITFTPVYHMFHKMIEANDRRELQCEMPLVDGRYELDLQALSDQMDGSERMVIFCSPHNPGGRVWTAAELKALADFCIERDLILVSDEIHQDLLFPGQKHTVMHLAAPEAESRMVLMTAPSKTFNIAGCKNAQVIIPDPVLREKMHTVLRASATGLNRVSAMLTTAAYAHGAEWLDALMQYLDTNRRMFDERINALPGLKSIPLEATYLSWVDFSGTGMPIEEFTRRIEQGARIAANHGPTFGKGGDAFMRFNIGTSRATVSDALERIEHAFSDLQ